MEKAGHLVHSEGLAAKGREKRMSSGYEEPEVVSK
jgi:hypothetical protein